MAITAQNGVYLTAGPAKSGQILANNEATGTEVSYAGTATFILDGASTSATLNFIDGTQTVQFAAGLASAVNASGVAAMVVGGTQPAAAFISVSTDTITATGCTVRFSIAGTAANTVKIAFFILR